MSKPKPTKFRYEGEASDAEIAAWMRRHVEEHFDGCDVNMTTLVEAWDHACASGGDTMDDQHPAWDVACAVALEFEARRPS